MMLRIVAMVDLFWKISHHRWEFFPGNLTITTCDHNALFDDLYDDLPDGHSRFIEGHTPFQDSHSLFKDSHSLWKDSHSLSKDSHSLFKDSELSIFLSSPHKKKGPGRGGWWEGGSNTVD